MMSVQVSSTKSLSNEGAYKLTGGVSLGAEGSVGYLSCSHLSLSPT